MDKIHSSFRTLTPAYGRDYKNVADVQEAFRQGLDFRIHPSEQYCSIRDFAPGVTVILRYAKQQKTTTYTIQ